jgi:hypothetical protein
MVPETEVQLLARDLRLSSDDVRAIISIAMKQSSPTELRRLTDLHSWTVNEASSYIDQMRRRLVELGFLDDLRIAQEIRCGPVEPYLQAEGRVESGTVEREGQPHERIYIRLDVAPFTFDYPLGAPNYAKIKEAVLTPGILKISARASNNVRANSTLRIRQLEKDGQVLVWFADTGAYFNE